MPLPFLPTSPEEMASLGWDRPDVVFVSGDTSQARSISFTDGIPPAKNGDYAWVQHMVASMDEKSGRVGVVMSHGALFRGGSEARIG